MALSTLCNLAVCTPSTPSPGPTELRIRGADISFTLQEEAANRTVTDNGEALPVEQILARHGSNYARLRVWVDPPRVPATFVPPSRWPRGPMPLA